MERAAIVIALLGKLGVENAEVLEAAQAEGKLRKRLAKGAAPEDMTDAETALVTELTGVAPAEAKPKGKATPKADPDAPETYKLPGNGKEADRVEVMTAKTAEGRNKRRSDERRWEPAPGATPTGAGAAGAKTAPAAAPKASPKGAAAPKGKTPAAPAAKAGKAAPAAAEPKPKATRKSTTRENSGMSLFKTLFPVGGKALAKTDVVASLVKAGVSEGSAKSYLVWAKRAVKDKNRNPFGFRIVETRDDKKGKLVQRA
jgi:hypothetical protein